MSSNQSGEGEIRKAIIGFDLVDCMIALPSQLFYGSPIPACLWFLARTKKNGKFQDRRAETQFVDARKLGHLVDRVHRDLSDEEVARIAATYHAWRRENDVRQRLATDARAERRDDAPVQRHEGGLEEVILEIPDHTGISTGRRAPGARYAADWS